MRSPRRAHRNTDCCGQPPRRRTLWNVIAEPIRRHPMPPTGAATWVARPYSVAWKQSLDDTGNLLTARPLAAELHGAQVRPMALCRLPRRMRSSSLSFRSRRDGRGMNVVAERNCSSFRLQGALIETSHAPREAFDLKAIERIAFDRETSAHHVKQSARRLSRSSGVARRSAPGADSNAAPSAPTRPARRSEPRSVRAAPNWGW